MNVATHPNGRRYPARLALFARSAAERGHSCQQIAAAIEKAGYPVPSRGTITEWIDPEQADVRRMRQRKRTTSPPRQRKTFAGAVIDRAHELRSLGVSYRSIADILNNDCGLSLAPDQVRHALAGRMSEASFRYLVAGGKLKPGRPAAGDLA